MQTTTTAKLFKTYELVALPETALSDDAEGLRPTGVGPRFLKASAMLPVFQLPKDIVIDDVVAVCHRNSDGLPIHGALFGVSNDGVVTKIALVDMQRGVHTDEHPAHIAFGLVMSDGDLLMRGDGLVRAVSWSIVDIQEGRPYALDADHTEARNRSLQAYVENILPFVGAPTTRNRQINDDY